MNPISPQSIAALIPIARETITSAVYRTPLERSTWLSEVSGADISLKLECYQPTGSFKVRGATAAISQLAPEERLRGVVTASAGNHGLGVAYAAARLGVRATVVVPDNATEAKVAALQRFPIELLRGGQSYDTAERMALDLARERDYTFVSPYNVPWVIAGQGTIGVELLVPASMSFTWHSKALPWSPWRPCSPAGSMGSPGGRPRPSSPAETSPANGLSSS